MNNYCSSVSIYSVYISIGWSFSTKNNFNIVIFQNLHIVHLHFMSLNDYFKLWTENIAVSIISHFSN